MIELRGVLLLIGTKNNASIYIEKGKFAPFAALTGIVRPSVKWQD